MTASVVTCQTHLRPGSAVFRWTSSTFTAWSSTFNQQYALPSWCMGLIDHKASVLRPTAQPRRHTPLLHCPPKRRRRRFVQLIVTPWRSLKLSLSLRHLRGRIPRLRTRTAMHIWHRQSSIAPSPVRARDCAVRTQTLATRPARRWCTFFQAGVAGTLPSFMTSLRVRKVYESSRWTDLGAVARGGAN
jgi:hypothetical protein